jgi:hypothetical protein
MKQTICVDLKSNGSRLQTQLIVLGQIAAYTTSYFDAWDQKIADVLIEDIINEPDNVSNWKEHKCSPSFKLTCFL